MLVNGKVSFGGLKTDSGSTPVKAPVITAGDGTTWFWVGDKRTGQYQKCSTVSGGQSK